MALDYYSKVLLGQDLDLGEHADSIFHGEEITRSPAILQDLASTVSTAYFGYARTGSAYEIFSLNICIVIAWDVLLKPLLVKDIDGDLL